MSASPDFEGSRPKSRVISSPPPSTDFTTLQPSSAIQLSSNSMHILSPNDLVGPSPVTSTGTEITEIEEDASEDIAASHGLFDSRQLELPVLTMSLPDVVRQSSNEEAVSAIHAPEGFPGWVSTEGSARHSQTSQRSSPRSDRTPPVDLDMSSRKPTYQPYRLPISTDVRPVRYSVDNATPQAQNLQDLLKDDSRMRSSSTSSLDKIDEQTEAEGDDDEDAESHSGMSLAQSADGEVYALRGALQECWTLCNTLANLSAVHRTRMFHTSSTPDAHAKAWTRCWKLCQKLYDCQDERSTSLSVGVTLDLCRDFCQALFDIRQKENETTDSVLRVSFELNNHLYSARDSEILPKPFMERTLEFYITLCHRLMKQRSELAEETNRLLSLCWALAEMLFNLRQNKRDGRPLDEALLSPAIQACWDLCDIFRDGWTQIRPDRSTPRPNQKALFSQQPMDQSGRESRQSTRSSLLSKRGSDKTDQQVERPRDKPAPVPETPVTEFEDMPVSPESRSPQVPNIMVLGSSSDGGRGGKWSSNASNMSSYSRTSNRTSSTATTTTAKGNSNISRTRMLVLRAAMNLGFSRDSVGDIRSETANLQKFVQRLPAGSFGPLPSHTSLLQQFKKSVLSDSFLPRNCLLPARGSRVSAHDLAKSVSVMTNTSSRYAYMRDLFQLIFHFTVEGAEEHRSNSMEV